LKFKCVAQEASQRTFVLILDPGEEAFSEIGRFAERERLDGAALTALVAFERAKLVQRFRGTTRIMRPYRSYRSRYE
jgi:predicted DNA-binding protein with PD1-like motif